MKTKPNDSLGFNLSGRAFANESTCLVRLMAFAGLAVGGAFLAAPHARGASSSLPTGGQTISGAASVSQNGSTLTVTQTTDKAVTHWQSFNVGAGNTVNFVQPSSSAVSLNRVIGNDVSVIQGAINANGKVFLLNPNGVLFTATAQVNVGGIVASTLRMTTEDFLAGQYTFEGAGSGTVVNQGNITAAKGGVVGLIAAKVTNTGSIVAPEGSVLVGAGNRVTLDLGGPIKIRVEEGVLDALVEQGGAIRADGGLVYLTAKAVGEVTSTVINHTGITEAKTIEAGKDGKIYLMGGMEKDRIVVAGKLDASAPNGGNGGFIETSAAKVKIEDDVQVTTNSTAGKSGTWLIDPLNFTITSGAGGSVVEGLATGSSIGATTLGNQLVNGDVTIETVGSGDGAGYIVLNSPVTRASGTGTKTLTLKAYEDIIILDSISGSAGSPLNIVLTARATGAANGMVYIGPRDENEDISDPMISTYGGNITIGGGVGGTGFAIGHVLQEESRGGKSFNNNSPVGVTLKYAVLNASNYIAPYAGDPTSAEGGGNIVIRSQGGVGTELAPKADGLYLYASRLITGGVGTITLDVQGGEGYSSSAGLSVDSSRVISNQGLISITATAGEGANRYGISNFDAEYGSFSILTNGSALLEGDAILVKRISSDGENSPGLFLKIGEASNIKAPLLGLEETFAYLQKDGAGVLTLWGNAQLWDEPSTQGTSTNGTFEDLGDLGIQLQGVTADQALYAFGAEARPSTTSVVIDDLPTTSVDIKSKPEVASTINNVYVVPTFVSRPASAELKLGLKLVDVAPSTESQSNNTVASDSFSFDPVAAAKRAPGTVLVLTGGVKRAAEDKDAPSEKPVPTR